MTNYNEDYTERRAICAPAEDWGGPPAEVNPDRDRADRAETECSRLRAALSDAETTIAGLRRILDDERRLHVEEEARLERELSTARETIEHLSAFEVTLRESGRFDVEAPAESLPESRL